MLERAPIAISDAAQRHGYVEAPLPRGPRMSGNALIVHDAGGAHARCAHLFEQDFQRRRKECNVIWL